MPTKRSVVRAVALIGGLSLLASSAWAQITLTPYAGSFYGFGKLVNILNGTLTAEQTNTAVFGARLSFPIGAVFSVEGAAAYANSDVLLRIPDDCVSNSTGGTFDCSTSFTGSAILGSVRMLFRPRRSNLNFLAGVAVASHGGEAWKGLNGTTDFGGVVGFGLRASITPKITINMTAECYLYSFDPDEGANLFNSQMQEDVLFTVGIPISITH